MGMYQVGRCWRPPFWVVAYWLYDWLAGFIYFAINLLLNRFAYKKQTSNKNRYQIVQLDRQKNEVLDEKQKHSFTHPILPIFETHIRSFLHCFTYIEIYV